jgi:hypothetical protein
VGWQRDGEGGGPRVTTALLVDADIIAYQFAAKAQRSYEFGVAVDDLEVVTPKLDAALVELEEELDGEAIICLSCPTAEGWRKLVLPTYKDNRSDVVKPELLAPIKDYLEANYPSYRKPTLEADDIMGILSTMDGLPPNFVREHPQFAKVTRKVIVSEDKDMKTVPGWLYNPAKDSKPHLIADYVADYWHLYQTLVGDSTDGYKGCPGIGPKKAEAMLRDGDDFRIHPLDVMWQRVLDAYAKKGLTQDDALVQARVARICRACDYDFKNREVVLWTPAQPQKD